MKPALRISSLAGIWVVLATGCAPDVESGQPLGASESALGSTASCATAPRDAVLNASADQAAGATSPSTYSNPGCDKGYIVEFDGTINGVHVGYKLEDPRASSTDGIHVKFPSQSLHDFFSRCEGAAQGSAYLYEQAANGTWTFLQSTSVPATTHLSRGFASYCELHDAVFTQVHKGSAATPHIYRVAASLEILDPAPFTGFSFPPLGPGPLNIRACDATHACN